MDSKAQVLKYDAVFLIAAAIWGFAFVAQRVGMQYVGPFTFIAARFLLGGLFLIPILILTSNAGFSRSDSDTQPAHKSFFLGSSAAGLILFLAASFQQHGLVYTTAGKAGFITGLYVVIVPIIGIRLGHKTGPGTWLGAILAVVGLYLLSIKGAFVIDTGDLYVFVSAFFWAAHVLIIARLSRKFHPIRIALVQFLICSAAAWLAAIITETIVIDKIFAALIPILYAGIMSTGIAFTLQVVAQRHAHPTHASIVMSTEAVFAVLGGYLFLDETLPLRNLAGCALMLTGMIISQLNERKQINLL
jgi:drug/metabolite transporter (DMT)-like permease